jgi:hypothetical protein
MEEFINYTDSQIQEEINRTQKHLESLHEAKTSLKNSSELTTNLIVSKLIIHLEQKLTELTIQHSTVGEEEKIINIYSSPNLHGVYLKIIAFLKRFRTSNKGMADLRKLIINIDAVYCNSLGKDWFRNLFDLVLDSLII